MRKLPCRLQLASMSLCKLFSDISKNFIRKIRSARPSEKSYNHKAPHILCKLFLLVEHYWTTKSYVVNYSMSSVQFSTLVLTSSFLKKKWCTRVIVFLFMDFIPILYGCIFKSRLYFAGKIKQTTKITQHWTDQLCNYGLGVCTLCLWT